jgi:hypothetical protein
VSAEDVARAIMAFEDQETREQVQQDGVTALGDLRLSPEEEALVLGAANESPDPEVSGFQLDQSPTFIAAMYASRGPFQPAVNNQFDSFLGQRFGGSIVAFRCHNWAYASGLQGFANPAGG